MYFPILDAADPELRQTTEVLALDFWYPLDDDPFTLRLCGTPGMQWRARSPYGPFDPPQDGASTRLLASDLPLPDGRPRALPLWRDDDPLAGLYTAWLGRYAADAAGERQLDAYRATAEVVDLPLNGAFPDLGMAVTPATATGAGLTYTGDGPGAVLVLVGDDPADLVRLWNARSEGGAVYPWPINQTGRFDAGARAWLGLQGTADAAHHFQSGDGSERGQYIAVSAGRHASRDVQRTVALIESEGWRAFQQGPHVSRGWIGYHPVQTEEERSYSVQVTREDWRIDVPMPRLPSGDRRRRRWPGIVVADVVVHRENQLPPGRSVSVPALRQLAPLLEHVGESTAPFQRSTGDGRAIGVQADVETVSVGLLPTLPVFEAMLERPGWSLRQSDEGRFGTQLIERLGGARGATANQPAVRAVLHRAGNAGRAHPVAALIQVASDSRGDWPDGLMSRLSPRDYAQEVVYWLMGRGLLRPALRVRCPHCATEVDTRPEDLNSTLRCQLCDSDFALGLALAAAGPANPWAYHLPANIPSARLRSALPVMATLAVIDSSRAGTGAALPHVLGLEVRAPGWSCELDIAAVVVDGPATLVVVGEVKGGTELIDANDLSNLKRVHNELRSKGIETLMLAATTRTTLAPGERSALRALCDYAPQRIQAGSTLSLSLPLVLTGTDLSVPWMSDQHPWRWGQPADPPMAGMALESCRRNLGLADIDYVQTEGRATPRPRWLEMEPN